MKLPDYHFVSPPKWIRYALERWSYEDAIAEAHAGETYAHTDCVSCHTIYGAYVPGEWIVDDTLSIDTWHLACAPRHTVWLGLLGTIVCLFQAVMGIDRHRQT